MNEQDLAAILESNFLSTLRTISVLFVAGIALFGFTDLGKNFSIISLLFALILLIALVTDYFIERSRVSNKGFFPRPIIDIIAFGIIGFILLLIWIIFTVWRTSQTSLTILAEDVEKEMKRSNQILIQNLQQIEDKIIDTNKDLIENIRNLNNPDYIPKYERDVPISKVTVPRVELPSSSSKLSLNVANKEKSTTVTNALLAAVS